MDRKSVARVISIDSARDRGPEEPPPTQAVNPKRSFFGNQHTEQRFFGMYQIWRDKVAQHYRVPAHRVDEQIVEAMHQRRAA